MKSKHSQAALIKLLESAIQEVGDLDSKRFYLMVRNVEVLGSPPTNIRAWALLRFLPSGAPFCCGEPACYSRVFRQGAMEELGDFVRRNMNLQHDISVELNVEAEYFNGIKFSVNPSHD